MKKPKFIPEFEDIPSARQKMPELSIEDRNLNFKEVELGFTEEMVLAEAARCLSCRRCIGCGLCLAECDPEAVVYDEVGRELTIEADAIIFTSDGKPFNPDSKPELGYGESADVITSLELDRLISPSGPFGGLLVRPFDGEIPKRIAFVQCIGSREEAIGANYCSVGCCSRTFEQARRAREMIDDVSVRVFHKGLRPIGKNSELDLVDLEGQEWIEFTQGAVTGINEDRATGEVTVTYERDGQAAEDKFDLAVLAVGVQSLRDFKRYARAGGAQVNKYGFVERNIAALLADGQGVTFGGAICGPTTAGRSLIDAVAAASSSLAACRSTDGLAKPEPSGKQVVFACEYGLRLMGRDGSIVEALKKDGLEIGGIHPFLCYKDGRKAMVERLQGTGRLIVVGCHRHSHEPLFETILGLPAGTVTILGRGDLGDELPTPLEAGLERRTEAQVQRRTVVRPTTVVVIGGGISGLAAAGELLRRGLQVVMVEKSAEIGESLRRAAISQGADVEVVKQFIEKLESDPGLTVHKSAEVTSIDKSDEGHTVKISADGKEDAVEAGAVLLATGSGASVPEGYGYGESDSVLTQADFTERIAKGETPWKRIVMIQCVGARDAEHPYCSRFCCKQALVNALLYKENNGEADIKILHRGIRVYGPEEELYTEAAENGITMIEIDGKPTVAVGKSLGVKAEVRQGEPVGLECDAVVLSVGHHHGESQARLAQMAGARLDGLGFLAASDPVADPFGTAARGIFACGFARGPVVAEDAFVEGLGAAGEICKYAGG